MWLFNLKWKVYTVGIPDPKTDALITIIRQKLEAVSIVYTDTTSSYKALDLSEFKQ